MARKPLRVCGYPGCSRLTEAAYCEAHNKRAPEHRDNAASRGYTYRWGKAAKAYLKAHPWCEMCKREGRHVLATEVDHKTPHKGSQTLFWNEDNWQGLCHQCHSRKTAKEDGGFGNTSPPSPEKLSDRVSKPGGNLRTKKIPG